MLARGYLDGGRVDNGTLNIKEGCIVQPSISRLLLIPLPVSSPQDLYHVRLEISSASAASESDILSC